MNKEDTKLTPIKLDIPFDNSFAREMTEFYTSWQGEVSPNPKIVQFNNSLADDLGLDGEKLQSTAGAQILSGSQIAKGSDPLAMVYAGHQFGHFSPQLGDGRALLIGEVIDPKGERYDIHLKGSGRTPYSRMGDGRAVIGPVLREYLMGEAMHAFGIPTTRALAAITTGEEVWREGKKPGAVLVRIAKSHIRVGSFQYFAARNETENLRKLADYAIKRHDLELEGQSDRYALFLQSVAKRQAKLIAKWLSVGFVHGVMNTDNMAISGETIDYGPCAFLDRYDPTATFSSIDQQRRYAFGRQPVMAHWNIARFAETLLPLIDENEERATEIATEIIENFSSDFVDNWIYEMGLKLGIEATKSDADLINHYLKLLQDHQMDYTTSFHLLGKEDEFNKAFGSNEIAQNWYKQWEARLGDDIQGAHERMRANNPIYIPRNHLVEDALSAAENDDYKAFNKLLTAIRSPYDERAGFEEYKFAKDGFSDEFVTFCGT